MVYNSERLNSIAEGVAKHLTEEEIVARPELKNDQENIKQRRKEQVKNELEQTILSIESDFALSLEIINAKIASLNHSEAEIYRTEFRKALQKLQQVGMSKECLKVMTEPFNEKSSCLQWELGLPDSLMEFIYSIGRELQDQNAITEGKALFRFLMALNPYQGNFWGQYGLLFMKEGNHEEARSSFEIARFFSPEDPLPYYLMALSYASEEKKGPLRLCCEEGLLLAKKNNLDSVWKGRFLPLMELAN